MRNLKLYSLLLLPLLLFSCAKQTTFKSSPVNENILSVGTFNIAWLGDGIDDTQLRNDSDYKLIAETIHSTNFDVIGLQEIENEAALKRVVNFLPDYKYIVSHSAGKQNVAVLYKDYIDLQYVNDYMPVAVMPRRTRPAMFLKVKKGNFDCYLMVVHFKSTSRYDDTPEKKTQSIAMRTQQAGVLSDWADSVLAAGQEQDLILMGDMNDATERKEGSSLAPLMLNKTLSFLTDKLTSCKYEKWMVIDQIVVSNSAKKRFQENSLYMENFRSRLPKEQADKISDHCPVGVAFEVNSPDND